MSIDWNVEIVNQVDKHWRDRLRPRLDGLTDGEYAWEPVMGCWSVRRRGESSTDSPVGAGEFVMDYSDPPPVHRPVATIAWLLAHLIDELGPPTITHFQQDPVKGLQPNVAGTAETALRQLDEAYDAWIADVRFLGAEGLAKPQGSPSEFNFYGETVAQLVMRKHAEVIHDGAEICLLRDLHRGSW